MKDDVAPPSTGKELPFPTSKRPEAPAVQPPPAPPLPPPPRSTIEELERAAYPGISQGVAVPTPGEVGPDGKPVKRGVGKPTKLSRLLIDAIAANVRDGLYPEQAAAVLHIPGSTFYNWLKKGKEQRGSPLNQELVVALAQAEARHELALVRLANAKDPVKVLERRYRSRWRPELSLLPGSAPTEASDDEMRDNLAHKFTRLATVKPPKRGEAPAPAAARE